MRQLRKIAEWKIWKMIWAAVCNPYVITKLRECGICNTLILTICGVLAQISFIFAINSKDIYDCFTTKSTPLQSDKSHNSIDTYKFLIIIFKTLVEITLTNMGTTLSLARDINKKYEETMKEAMKEVMANSDKKHEEAMKEVMANSNKKHEEAMANSNKKHEEAMANSNKKHEDAMAEHKKTMKELKDVKALLAKYTNDSTTLDAFKTDLINEHMDTIKHRFIDAIDNINWSTERCIGDNFVERNATIVQCKEFTQEEIQHEINKDIVSDILDCIIDNAIN